MSCEEDSERIIRETVQSRVNANARGVSQIR
jgi:hypothetical protein